MKIEEEIHRKPIQNSSEIQKHVCWQCGKKKEVNDFGICKECWSIRKKYEK